MHYLLLDDDEIFCATLGRALARRGLAITQCHSLSGLQDIAGETTFDRAVVDLKIGEDNGLVAIKLLRERQPDCEILMLTGYASIVTAIEAIKIGAKNYLPKPAGIDDILRAFESNTTLPAATQPPSVDRLEWEHIQRVLHENAGNISATARALNMHRRTLQRKLAKRPVCQ
jgi:two-component system, response regulator RegA